MQSEFLKINWLDLGKGVLVAVLTVVLQGVIDILQTGLLPTLQQIYAFLGPGLAAGLAYILKNLFTNSQNELGKAEAKII
jgi:hypothetical protein